METHTIIRRSDELAALNKLAPLVMASADGLRNLAVRFSAPGWKELFIRYWQQDERCLAELTKKIREIGGSFDTEFKDQPTQTGEISEEIDDPLLLDKHLLLRCLNDKTQTLEAYAHVRKNPLSFDTRMLLQRHHLQAREALERLTAIYLSYPTRPTRPLEQDSPYPYHRA